MQGAVNSLGHGDYFEQGRFNTLVEAKKFFNKVKHDTRGYDKNKILDTLIEVHYESNDEELNEALEEATCRQCDNIIESYQEKIRR